MNMSEIPEDVLASAKEFADQYAGDEWHYANRVGSFVRAIMAERERCAFLAETHPKHLPGGWSGDPTCHAIASAIRNPSP